MSDIQSTEKSLIECFEKAKKAGSIAANQRVEELSKKKVPEGKMLDACGGVNTYPACRWKITNRQITGKISNK